MSTTLRFSAATALAALMLGLPAQAITLPAAFAGSDGAFEPGDNVVVDLSQAATGQWDLTPGSGNGVYDPAQWAVIFRFSSINIPNFVTVTFKNHPSGAPVIWLSQGNVTIAGGVNLDGADGGAANMSPIPSEPGPGGFRGGRRDSNGVSGGAGFGPGGATLQQDNGSDASHATAGTRNPGAIYGNPGLFPLIGGSGGAVYTTYGAGAGGGAILIATPGAFSLTGYISAQGGGADNYSGAGSGGGIRIIADSVSGTGNLRASGGLHGGDAGGNGRIRIETNTNELEDIGSPPASVATAAENPRIFRTADDGIPSIRAVTLGGETVPDDPRPRQTLPPDVQIPEEGTQTLAIEAVDVPSNSVVTVRVIPLTGDDTVYQAIYTGDGAEPDVTLWSVDVDLLGGFSTIQVYAALVE